jgi:hypothetical protein
MALFGGAMTYVDVRAGMCIGDYIQRWVMPVHQTGVSQVIRA